MNYIALKTIIAVGIIIAIYFIAKRKKKTKKELKEKSLDDPAVIAQNKKNTKFIAKIIEGHYREILAPDRLKYIKAFDDWQKTQGKFFRDASESKRKIFDDLMRKRRPKYGFKGQLKRELPDSNYELVMENCFTEPFPSTHDMDDWALDNLIMQFMVFEIIKPFMSENYYIHLKMHFVNHDMVQAIIMVDVYKKKN